MTKSGEEGGKSSPFCFQHEKQEIILHHKGSTQIMTLFLFREEGRCSMRAVTMVGKRARWRYLHEGCRCDPLCTESWVKHLLVHLCLEHKTWGIFQLNILSITGYRLKPHSLIIMQEESFSLLKSIPCERFAYLYFFRERPKCNSLFSPMWVNHLPLYKPPCHTHTYKAYFYIICFKLCVMTLNSELTPEQAT